MWSAEYMFLNMPGLRVDCAHTSVLGPILRRVDMSVRHEVALRLSPRTLFLMPALAFITGTTGWYLAAHLGFLAVPWPQFGWVAAALVLITLAVDPGLRISAASQCPRVP